MRHISYVGGKFIDQAVVSPGEIHSLVVDIILLVWILIDRKSISKLKKIELKKRKK